VYYLICSVDGVERLQRFQRAFANRRAASVVETLTPPTNAHVDCQNLGIHANTITVLPRRS